MYGGSGREAGNCPRNAAAAAALTALVALFDCVRSLYTFTGSSCESSGYSAKLVILLTCDKIAVEVSRAACESSRVEMAAMAKRKRCR